MNKFMKLQQEQTEHLWRNRPYGYPTENDMELNELNRQIIAERKKAIGTAFIGSINCNSSSPKMVLEEYTRQAVPNFGCDFCVPVYDTLLADLITEWNRANKIEVLNKIFNRIKHLGGIVFIWA